MSSSDSDSVDNPAVMDTPRSKRKLMFYGSHAKKPSSSSSRVRKEKETAGEERGDLSDITIDDSDNDPDYVMEEQCTPIESPVNIGASTSRRNVESTPVAGGSVGDSAGGSVGGSAGGSAGSSSSKKHVVKIGRKRKVNKDEWVQNVAKSRRQRGLEYKSYKTKKIVPKRVPGPPCRDGYIQCPGELLYLAHTCCL